MQNFLLIFSHSHPPTSGTVLVLELAQIWLHLLDYLPCHQIMATNLVRGLRPRGWLPIIIISSTKDLYPRLHIHMGVVALLPVEQGHILRQLCRRQVLNIITASISTIPMDTLGVIL